MIQNIYELCTLGMTHTHTMWPGQVPLGSDIWGSAQWSEAPGFGISYKATWTDIRHVSDSFRSFHSSLIIQRFSTSEREVTHIDKTSYVC